MSALSSSTTDEEALSKILSLDQDLTTALLSQDENKEQAMEKQVLFF